MWEVSLENGPFPELIILALAMLLDLALGEVFPARLHPVVWMGKVIQFLERLVLERLAPVHRDHPGPSYREQEEEWSSLPSGGMHPWTTGPSRMPLSMLRANKDLLELLFGAALAVLVPGAFAAAAYFALEGLRTWNGIGYILVGALVLKSTFAVRMLDREATRVYRGLKDGRLEDAKADLRSLVSRDTSGLTPELAAAATVESVAENTTDSFIAPWLAFAVFGVPGAVAYRAINTLDSMIGYHGIYEHLGKASARLDDLVNLAPARLTALLILAGGALGPGRFGAARKAWGVMWRYHARTESPNAGWTMSSMAGTLGVRLEKLGHYQIGDSETSAPVPRDIKRAIARMYFVGVLGLVITLGTILVKHAVL